MTYASSDTTHAHMAYLTQTAKPCNLPIYFIRAFLSMCTCTCVCTCVCMGVGCSGRPLYLFSLGGNMHTSYLLLLLLPTDWLHVHASVCGVWCLCVMCVTDWCAAGVGRWGRGSEVRVNGSIVKSCVCTGRMSAGWKKEGMRKD